MPPITLTLTPLGIAVEVTAATRELADAAIAMCEGWSGPAEDGAPTLRLDLAIGGSFDGDCYPNIAIDGNRMTLRGGQATAIANASVGFVRCEVSPALAASPEGLGSDVLEPLLLFLLTRRGRTPIHAAGVVIGERTVILAGPSGTGKSCLALAASAAGLALLSDDTVFVERGPPAIFRAQSRPIHVFDDDVHGASAGPERLRNGKLKRAVVAGRHLSVSRHPPALCLLARGTEASLARLTEAEALAALPPLEPGFDLLADEIGAVFAMLAAGGAWRLTLSADPADAIALLRARFEGGT